jgi:hypothetical protein
MADPCYLGGWKSPLTVMTVYQEADQVTMRNALTNRDQPCERSQVANRQQTLWQNAETPLRDVSISGAISSDSWAWVELNYRPHAYQACALTT